MSLWSLWLLSLLVIIGSILAYSTWILKKPVEHRLRKGLTALRIVFLCALVLLLAEPRISRQIRKAKVSYLAILIDDSESMTLPAQGESPQEPTRIERVRSLLSPEQLARFSRQNLSVSLWRASDLSPIADLESLQADAPFTHLGDALQDLGGKFDQAGLKAVLMLSDGQNTGGSAPERVAARLGVPVFTLGLGSEEASWDIAIDELIVPEQAFQGESVPLHVILSQRGGEEEQTLDVRFRVSVEGESIAEETLSLPAGQNRYEWSLERVFSEPGHHQIMVEIEPQMETPERVPLAVREAQRKATADLTILRNRYGIVLLSGRPGWESRYARRAFEEDPRFEVLSLWQKPGGGLTLIETPESRADARDSTLKVLREKLRDAASLDALFENLSGVDLLVLSDLSIRAGGRRPADLNSSRIQALIRWVDQDGGRLILLGGEEMFASGGSVFQELAPLLPVQLARVNDYRTQPVFPRLTDFGQRSEALVTWRQFEPAALGPMVTSHRLGSPRLGAEVLLEDQEGNPLLAWHSFGSGRVMVLATDSFWRYGLPLAERTVTPEQFGNFWREKARFLILGRQGGGLRLYTDGQHYYRGEPVRVWAYVDANIQTEESLPRIPVMIQRDGDEVPERVFLSRNPQAWTLYEGSFRPQQTGHYTLQVEMNQIQDEKRIEVSAPREEYRWLHQNVALLQEVAQVSGGSYLRPEELDRLPSRMNLVPETEIISRSVFVGSLPWVLPLLLAVITAEWILRKRASLP